jgi:uncharacterized protein YcfJ
MLKRTLLASCFGLLLVAQNVQAGDAARTGALGGAAGGAILGQAIGRDTKGTLIGTAIGGVLGYMIGNDIDQQREGYYPRQRVVTRYEDDYPEVQVVRTRVYERPVVYCPPERVVRQTVIIDRGRDYPPRYWGHGRDHWRETRYRPEHHGYRGRGRD